MFSHDYLGENPDVVFMFPGGGAQYAGMGQELYATQPTFRAERAMAALRSEPVDVASLKRWISGAEWRARYVERLGL